MLFASEATTTPNQAGTSSEKWSPEIAEIHFYARHNMQLYLTVFTFSMTLQSVAIGWYVTKAEAIPHFVAIRFGALAFVGMLILISLFFVVWLETKRRHVTKLAAPEVSLSLYRNAVLIAVGSCFIMALILLSLRPVGTAPRPTEPPTTQSPGT